MAGDPFKTVAAGQRMEIPAAAYNAFLDAARQARGRLHETDRDEDAAFRQTGIVKVRNQAGYDQARYAVLALRDPIIGPGDDLQEFKNKVSFDGVKPVAPAKGERFAVLLEPLAADAIGRGIVAGVTPVQVNVVREADPYAEVVADETGNLRSSPFGLTRILWKEPGLGVKWAVVRLSERPRFAIFRLDGQWAASTSPDPDGWARMSGCRPVFYFDAERTYRADTDEPTETVWHATGYPPAERDQVRNLHRAYGVFPAKVACGDWVWCHWNEHESRWQVLAGYEDHWRFKLLGALGRCGSASAQLVLYQGGKWCPVNLTFTVHDSVGVVGPDICKALGSSGSGCGCPPAPTASPSTTRTVASGRCWRSARGAATRPRRPVPRPARPRGRLH